MMNDRQVPGTHGTYIQGTTLSPALSHAAATQQQLELSQLYHVTSHFCDCIYSNYLHWSLLPPSFCIPVPVMSTWEILMYSASPSFHLFCEAFPETLTQGELIIRSFKSMVS